MLVNHAGEYITSFSATSAGRDICRYKRTVVNLGFRYQVRPALQVACPPSLDSRRS